MKGQDSDRPAEPPGAAREPAAESELARLREQMLRLQADFENARKRWGREQAEIQEAAYGELLARLVEVQEDFERALSVKGEPEGFRAGVEMIQRRLGELLSSYGVKPMEVVGKPFDPLRHEAVAHEPTEDVPESTVVAEIRRGYVMDGKVLRPAVVRVAVRPAADHPAEGSGEGSGGR